MTTITIVILILIACIAIYVAYMYRNRHKRLLDILNILCNIEESARDCAGRVTEESCLPAHFAADTLHETEEIRKEVSGFIRAISKRWWSHRDVEHNVSSLVERVDRVWEMTIEHISCMQQEAQHEQDSRL